MKIVHIGNVPRLIYWRDKKESMIYGAGLYIYGT